MVKYSPFLKMKQNEVQAIRELSGDVSLDIRPVFDIPRESKEQTLDGIKDRLRKGKKEVAALFKGRNVIEFYLDNYDLDDSIYIDGSPQYGFILNDFRQFYPIPVLAFDRDATHNAEAMRYVSEMRSSAAIRLQRADVESYRLARSNLQDLMKDLSEAGCRSVHLLIDLRVSTDPHADAGLVSAFIGRIAADFEFHVIVVSASVIPAGINALLSTNSQITVLRSEKVIWDFISAEHNVLYGDYGVVSPDYSDIDFDPRFLRRFAAPKVFYTHGDHFSVLRGAAFDSHPKGNGQYFDIADALVAMPFFRSVGASYGEKYIYDRSHLAAARPAKAGNPGSWIKATLASHISYIVATI